MQGQLKNRKALAANRKRHKAKR